MEPCILKLHEIGAIKFGDFLLKSGIRSPIYIDLRVLVAYPTFLERIAHMMWELASDDSYDQICGVPYTALPIACIVSLKQNIPMLMKRKEQKDHGIKKPLEGVWKSGDSCLLLEDVIVSGSSIFETIEVLEKEQLKVKQAIVFIDRQQGGVAHLEREGFKIKSVFTLDKIVNVLAEKKILDLEVAENIRHYIKSNDNVPIPPPKDTSNSDGNIPNARKLPLTKRIEMTEHPATKKLFKIMHDKKTNLCVAADVCLTEELLKTAEKVGPHICILKVHIDILENFNGNTLVELKQKAAKHNFLIMEDRKFADIGNTVQSQYAKGMHKIVEYADLVTLHGVPGCGVITGLKSMSKKSQAGIIVAEMSSKGNLCDSSYVAGCVSMAKIHPDFVIGFVAQSNITSEAGHVIMTPGISLEQKSDSHGQQYKSPTEAMQSGSDIIIVGRSIIGSDDVEKAAKEYKEICYSLFVDRLSE